MPRCLRSDGRQRGGFSAVAWEGDGAERRVVRGPESGRGRGGKSQRGEQRGRAAEAEFRVGWIRISGSIFMID